MTNTTTSSPADGPIIIEAAINGATSRDKNPNVPVEPHEIAADALACIEAGAAIIHNHIDLYLVDEATAADRYLEGWNILLAERPDALIYPTIHATLERSYEHQVILAQSGLLRLGIVDPGSTNLGGVDADGVPAGGIVYDNSYGMIARAMQICEENRLGPSMAIYEPGFLRTVIAYDRAGKLPAGSMVKIYFSSDTGYLGAPFGLPPTHAALDAYLELLDDIDVPWAISLVGGDVIACDIVRRAVEAGAHLHLGLEFYNGDRTPTNVELVTEAVALCHDMGRTVATPDEAAAILGLPRPAKV